MVDPAPRRARRGGQHVDERRGVVVGDLLALVDLLDGERRRPDRVELVGGRAVELLARGDLDLAHRLEVRMVGPDLGQLGTGVARDHQLRDYARLQAGPMTTNAEPRRRLASRDPRARGVRPAVGVRRRAPRRRVDRRAAARARMPGRRSRRSAPTAATGGRSASSTRSRRRAASSRCAPRSVADPCARRGRRRRRRGRPVGRPRPRPALVPPRGAAPPVDVERGGGGRRSGRRADVRADRPPRRRPLGPDLPPDPAADPAQARAAAARARGTELPAAVHGLDRAGDGLRRIDPRRSAACSPPAWRSPARRPRRWPTSGSRAVVPGANDNLSAVGALVGLAAALRDRPVEGARVLLVSTGSEESFSEGMQGFGERHFDDLDPDADRDGLPRVPRRPDADRGRGRGHAPDARLPRPHARGARGRRARCRRADHAGPADDGRHRRDHRAARRLRGGDARVGRRDQAADELPLAERRRRQPALVDDRERDRGVRAVPADARPAAR